MTRINCIPPEELTDKHLVAEYRELPRVFKLARVTKPGEAPTHYTMGKGHVLFFYDKLAYCNKRFLQLVAEMKRRGFKPQYTEMPQGTYLQSLFNDWTPTEEAKAINRQRIWERLNGLT